ncbi:methylenetetrahydrofolate reductase [Zobellella maritima]|uniref:methylenetetrahydrofolate reductase n=1 Tax=Zobellella maritima TaxID=2059725 RepID=UPI00130071E2|nr:methylenetetrahydrofolate reductase [Zobellella maritima]
MFTDFSMETTAKNAARFLQARPHVPEGAQVKIAFLGNETFEQRLQAVETLHASRVSPMPIISSRRLESLNVLDSYLTQATRTGQIRSIFLVGGDPSSPRGPFIDSMDVINSHILDKADIDTVGIAGYPEGHPRIGDQALWDYLKRKIHALTARGFSVEITTQLSFDVELVMSWIERVRREKIDVPIRVGIPSPSTVNGLLKFAGQCHVGVSMRLLRQYGWKITSLLGTVGPEHFLSTLQDGLTHRELGDVRLHVYPMGELSGVMKWIQGYSGTAA